MYEKHIYIAGKSGSGKSTFLEHHAIENPSGWILLDPHGDTAERLADTVPCIYWDTSDTQHAIGFNVLEHVREDKRHLVAANVVASFKAIWGASWGPRLEWILYNCVRLLLDAARPPHEHHSLLDIPTVLTNASLRTRIVRRSTLPDFWHNEFDEWDARYRNDAIAPVLNKVGQLTSNPVLSAILCRNTIDLPTIMNKGHRLVVNLSKGKLGEEPSHLLGALLVSAIAHAAQGRSTLPQNQRVPCTLYVDEFQNFATESFADILSESRKFGLFCVLSHQFLGQLKMSPPRQDYLRDAVFGNVGCFVSFKVSAEDAPVLAKEIGCNAPLLDDLAPYEAIIREGHGYIRKKMPPPIEPAGRLRANRRHTRAAYTRKLSC